MEGVRGNRCGFSSLSAAGRDSRNFSNRQSTVSPGITAQDGQASSGTSLSYGHPFGSPYYGQKAYSYDPAEKYMESSSTLPAEELSNRPKELSIHPSFVPGVSADPETRHETSVPLDRYQHWAKTIGWDEELYCSKEQTHFNHLWKSTFSDVVPHQTEMNGFCRGRKKRVPYNKTQLKELEREYATKKFLTRDQRRRLSAATNLSERQVNIWFQNRRVKEKKSVSKEELRSHVHVH
ncbi:homeobox protein Hox-C13b [Puntigrus tetrazona]|uniref:homeobox protein Hox-C13b n=1 Tax=Puntigrus tetrazona TaxID=1606681 RepID=UPI001C8A33B4|nr:homeobox protein Hox-C13b [Puntigrus tetrazona]